MSLGKRFLGFWYEFIIGDDWVVAAGVVLLLAASAALARADLHSTAWVVVPLGVAAILAVSLRRAINH